MGLVEILVRSKPAPMKILSLSEAKARLSGLVRRVSGSDEEIVITRNGRPAAVIVSHDEYEAWKETLEVVADSDFLKEIHKGLRALRQRKAKLYTLEELFS